MNLSDPNGLSPLDDLVFVVGTVFLVVIYCRLVVHGFLVVKYSIEIVLSVKGDRVNGLNVIGSQEYGLYLLVNVYLTLGVEVVAGLL